MSRYYSYLESAKKILLAYKGEEPFASFIKKSFSADKKYGSTDRKHISHLCYCYFRLGKALKELPADERILAGLFLCSGKPNEFLQELKPGWNEKTGLAIMDKASIIGDDFSSNDIFPWADELSSGIEKNEFILSHLEQRDLFLRLRPGKEETVKQKLTKGGIEFQSITNNCIALVNSSKVDKLIAIDKEAVVQDYSSQRVGEFINAVSRGFPKSRDGEPDRVWDCCAGSGGKSILLYDLNPFIDLTVSDVRESILSNLKKRFNEAGISKYKSLVVDLAHSPLPTPNLPFDLIIADVPCSGSGTWSRTPEQLYYFERRKIDEYAALQKKIVTNSMLHLAPAGFLLYITCSVFKKENEEVVNFIREKFHLQQEKTELLKGYDRKADTLFAALLKKPL